MTEFLHSYARLVRPALVVLSALSALAAAVLVWGGDPVGGAAPGGLLTAVVAGLVVLGVALPAGVALLGEARRAPWMPALAGVCAAMMNSVAMSGEIRVTPQPVFSLLCIVLGLGMAVVALVVHGDERSSRPLTSKFR